MILIGQEIIDTLKAVVYPVPVTVRDFYSADKIATPLLTVDELPGNEGVYLDNQPAIVTNTYTIEVYAKQKTVGGVLMSSKALALSIILAADKALNEVYGLTMTGQIAIAPYENQDICRVVARYVAYIDTRNDTILRRL